MNQFKDVFTGRRTLEYSRAASAQKCLRAGGKHNDLDNVGFTSRHHTFFEMLGNFSFGDYFKEEAIVYAWEWITKSLGLPKDKLWASVYDDDDDAFALWEKVAPELKNGRILRFGKKDNYWSMGTIGPCGPCSEIHFDRGEKYGTGTDDVVNGESERFVEIWNLVFMQFDQNEDGKVIPLPKPSVDTGAGLERIAAIMQGKESNYEIDLFVNIIKAISDVTGAKYSKHQSSHHVVADHLRALAFSLADGAGISNEGRGYVLRRILRRAARHGRLLGAKEPFMYKLVPALVGEMGNAYPELKEKEQHVQNVIKAEEESFGRTLDTGLELLSRVIDTVTSSGDRVIPGEEIFRLYDTYGFPYDLTETIATEQGLTLDQIGFERTMQAQRERSRSNSVLKSGDAKQTQEMIDFIDSSLGFFKWSTVFLRGDDSHAFECETKTCAALESVTEEHVSNASIVIEKTPFYSEAGGQVSDIGVIENSETRLVVTNLEKYKDIVIHSGYFEKGHLGDLGQGTNVSARIDAPRRWDIMRNHTATHLAHKALQIVLGDHVRQSGSYVGPDRLRFDFSHHQPMSADEIRKIEKIVNDEILEATKVTTVEMPIDEARISGAMALFGEKYGDLVRVVSIGDFSKELCGGTHVKNVSQIGPFFIVSETGVASGVRRLEAITGRAAQEHMRDAKEFRAQVSEIVGRSEAEALRGVKQLLEMNTSLQKDLKKARAAMFSGGGGSVGHEQAIGKLTYIHHDFEQTDKETMAAWIDSLKADSRAVVAFAFGQVNGSPTCIIAASGSAEKKLKMNVGALFRNLLPKYGGRGGGKPTFAQGSVAQETSPGELFDALAEMISEELGEK